MTVCIALIGKKGETVVGTDSLATWDDVGKPLGPKFLQYHRKDIAIAYAGSTRVAQIAEKILKESDPFTTKFTLASAKKFADMMQKALFPATPTGEMENDSQFLLCGHRKVIEIDGDFAVYKHTRFASIGSGGPYAEIGLMVADKMKPQATARQKVSEALRATCTMVNSCGGRVHIKSV